MVNMYGAGKAFNLRYQQNNYRMMPRPMGPRQPMPRAGLFGCHGSHCGPTNVTINQGPQGFWGFMTGLCQGLFGGMFGGFGMGMGLGGFSPFGMLNGLNNTQQTQDTEAADKARKFQNLQTMYSNYKVIDNGDGTYVISKGEGDVVAKGTYDELIKGLPTQPKVDNPEEDNPEVDNPEGDNPSPTPQSYSGAGATPGTAATADDIKGYNGKFTVSDKVRGDAGNITRNNCIMSSEKVDGFPKQITVGGYTYDYVRTEDGAAIYKSTAASAAGDEYRLEKNADGTFGLNQYKGMKGAGTADITQASKAATVKSPGHDNLTGEKPWTAEQKAEYNQPVEVQFAVSTRLINTGGTATVKMPDGTVFTAETGLGTDKGNFEALAQDLLGQIHAAGWTGVTTLQNTNPNMQEAFDGTNSWSKSYDPNVGAVSNNPKTQGADAGETVAENLGGYTTDNEKQEAIQLIQAQTPQSIKSFLNGYNGEREIGKEDIMTQIAHENEWSDIERKSSYQKIIANVLVASKEKIGTDAYKGLQDLQNNLLQNKIQTLSEDQAIAADKWIKELME